jgi:hypothetical protein
MPVYRHFKADTKATVVGFNPYSSTGVPCYNVQVHGTRIFTEMREDQLIKAEPTPYEVGMTLYLTQTYSFPPITLGPGTKVTVLRVNAAGYGGQNNHYAVRHYLNKTAFLDFGSFENQLSITPPEEGKS